MKSVPHKTAHVSPARSLEENVIIAVFRTAELLNQASETFLKPFGLTRTQYNVLRILRGAGEEGMTCSQIGERMIARDPDITRLLDRMESSGFVARARSLRDRRVVNTQITQKAVDLLSEIDKPLQQLVKVKMKSLGNERLSELLGALKLVCDAWD